LSRYVDVGADFEMHRTAVEPVSVLFELYDGDADGYAATVGRVRSCPPAGLCRRAKFEVD
jgi:putative transposase